MIFRWGHFADLHFEFSRRGFNTQTMRKKLLNTLGVKVGKLHAILIAGDLYHRGMITNESTNNICEFVREIGRKTQCAPGNIYICPGNHDLPRNAPRASSLANIIGTYDQPTDSNLEPGLNTDGYESIIHENACQNFRCMVNTIRGAEDAPLLHKLFPTDFANIIILNTAIFAGQTYPGQKNGPKSSVEDTELYIADHHLHRLVEDMLEAGLDKSGKLNIVLAHHGTGCFVRKEFHKLAAALDDMGIDLYLCGHVHQNHHEIITRTNYIPQISCGGLFEDGYNSPSFLIGEYNTDTREVTITAYEFNRNQSDWVPSAAFPRPWKGSTLTFIPYRLATQNPYLSILKEIAGNLDFSHKEHQLCTYTFVRQIHDSILPHLKSVDVRNDLEHILRDCVCFEQGKATRFCSKEAQRIAFVAYYSLALVYKNDGQISVNNPPSIGMLVDTYSRLFSKEAFPLSEEVHAWHYRYKGDTISAYTCDSALVEMLPIEVNAGVYASFASSICAVASQDTQWKALYGSDRSKLYQDWKKAYLNMEKVIPQWQSTWGCPGSVYPKHRFILGKLLYFAAKFNWSELYQDNILGNNISQQNIVIMALKHFSEVQSQDNDKATYKTSAFPEYQKWSMVCLKLLGQSLNPSLSEERQDYVNV